MKAEQFIKDYTKTCSNELCAVEDRYGKKVISYHEWLTPEQALSAVQIARSEAIEEACQYIKDNLYKYLYVCDGQAGFPTAEFIKYLKSAIEEEV